jgi:hypothetical protein
LGCATAVNVKQLRESHRPRLQEEAIEALCEWKKDEIIQEGNEESQRWDAEWWRTRLCVNMSASRPKFNPRFVFKHGSMHSVWQGRLDVRITPLPLFISALFNYDIQIPQAEVLQSIYAYPYYPG